jgi:glycosyltransferase involved in cell wall biosynthesis
MLPLGVILPTRNSRSYLERHLDALAPWLPLAQQVVVVDSVSTDGTLEFLRANLKHANAAFLNHPPGLYQSWNFGIAQLKTDYTYISTIGETITRAGLEHLVQHIQSADVIISPPAFRDQNHHPLPAFRWPIHDVIADLQITTPQALDKWTAFFFICFHALGDSVNSVLGSSASNLYRTATLQKHPFPSEWGTAGDTAWSVANVFQIKWAVSPMVCSTYLFHPKTNGNSDELNEKLALTLTENAEALLKKGLVSADPALADLLPNLLATLGDLRQQHFELRRLRSGKRVPWLLNAQAWQARLARKRLEQRLANIKSEYLNIRH